MVPDPSAIPKPRSSERREDKPVLVTVDDDVAVSRAVARDLRRRYGERYRIVRAESGAEALEALRGLKLRGDRVALLLADHRMPQMNGVDFLERAIGLYPDVKRVLLTAYADTDAAIKAINNVELDHYLLKPWDPPEEQLYPIVDDLLEEWHASDRPAGGVRVVGHRWSLRSHEIKDFLARNQVPYRWLDVATDSEAARILDAAGVDDHALPVVVTEGGAPLQAPSTLELAEAIGLRTRAQLPFYDLIIVGGGPSGLAAAVYGASEGLDTILIEREAAGGQAGQSSKIENYLGFPTGVSGTELTRRAKNQAERFGAEILTVQEVSGLDVRGSARVVKLSNGTELGAHTVIIASGVAYRRLMAPGLDDFAGRGVYYGAAITEALSCRDDDVFVIGGANSAGQAAVYFSRFARSVTVVARADLLERGMSRYLIEQIDQQPNVSVETNTEVVAARGDGHLQSITLLNRATGERREETTNYLFVFIGASPRTDWVGDEIQRDSRGFIVAGPDLMTDGKPPRSWKLERDPFPLETSAPGVFVAGDVRQNSIKRVASAVGEGAMAVQLVHRYLEKL